MSVPDSVEAIQRLSIIPAVLETVCRITGMRFAAVARVTGDNWTACAVVDHVNFGLRPGGELVLNSTICDEIRMQQQPVIFGHASAHPVFSTHHTPRIYGPESYVSVPILTEENRFFGTLCAIESSAMTYEAPFRARVSLLISSASSKSPSAESGWSSTCRAASSGCRDSLTTSWILPGAGSAVESRRLSSRGTTLRDHRASGRGSASGAAALPHRVLGRPRVSGAF